MRFALRNNTLILQGLIAELEIPMDRFEAMSIFVAVADGGSLAAAARKLGRSPASVTRAVASLEATAGEQLIERSTRRLALSEAGFRHLATYRRVLGDLAELHAPSPDAAVRGSVVITAPELFGRMRVMPVVESFLAAHREAQVRLLLLNRVVDLVGEGVDVAVRLAHLPDSAMTAVRLGAVRRLTCAAPAYLAEHGSPVRPLDLADHRCIGLNDAGTQALWRYREAGPGRRVRSVRVNCRLALNGAGAAIDAAERGLGIVRPLSYQVERQIADGILVALLEPYEPEEIPVHLVFRPRRADGSAVRAFIDHATPLLRRQFKDERP